MNKAITIEPLDLNHAKRLYILTEANRDYLREWLPWLDGIHTVDDTISFIQAAIDARQNSGTPNFAIFFRGELCGTAGFHEIKSAHKRGAIGYWLAESWCGRGIMTDVVRELVRQAFSELGLNRLEIRCAEGNRKSRAIPERLGFAREGVLRQNEWLYDRYVDHVVYAMLRSEYMISS